MTDIAFPKALLILEKLLQGKTPKEIAYDLDCCQQQVTITKKMFPLFTGGANKYDRKKP